MCCSQFIVPDVYLKTTFYSTSMLALASKGWHYGERGALFGPEIVSAVWSEG